MPKKTDQIIAAALREDRTDNDITTALLVDNKHVSTAVIIAKEDAVVCGVGIVKRAIQKLDPKAAFAVFKKDSSFVKKGEKVIRITGRTRALLSAERTALNFLAHLSGIATLTKAYVHAVKGRDVQILDTRKTTPGLRSLEKMAVRDGGGKNHRLDLSALVLLKDNHWLVRQSGQSIAQVIRAARQKTSKPIEVEVDNLKQFRQVLEANPDIILLDNMPPQQLRQAVKIRKQKKSRCLLEASGGITLNNIRKVASTGIDLISVGALTHSARAIDFSLEFLKT